MLHQKSSTSITLPGALDDAVKTDRPALIAPPGLASKCGYDARRLARALYVTPRHLRRLFVA
jgi:hypothetical protein